MSVSHFSQPMLQLLFMYKVARMVRMDVCVLQHGLPLTKAYMTGYNLCWVCRQPRASSPINPQDVTTLGAAQLTTWYQVDSLHWIPHIRKVQHFVLPRINIYSRGRFVLDSVSTSITIHGLISYFVSSHVGWHSGASYQSAHWVENELTLR